MNQYLRPDECHYNTTDYNHALERVRSMSSEQMVARYGKMTKHKKISAFYDALVAEGHGHSALTRLKEKMAEEHSYLSQAYSGVVESHTLIQAGSPDIYYVFQNDSMFQRVYVENHMGETTVMDVKEARKLWNRLVAEQGYTV